LADDIRHIYRSDSLNAQARIEAFLLERFASLSEEERVTAIKNVSDRFMDATSGSPAFGEVEKETLSGICTLLLGRDVCQADLSTPEVLEKLAESLNTIFDSLNQLVNAINTTLLGGSRSEETIRGFIRFHLEGEDQTASLESYLGQINKAFVVAQDAFKAATHSVVGRVLKELDPQQREDTDGRKLKFGPFRKAELFDLFVDRYERCKTWFESDRFMKELLREFENNCLRLSS